LENERKRIVNPRRDFFKSMFRIGAGAAAVSGIARAQHVHPAESVPPHWNLLRLNRLLGRLPEVERLAAELGDLNPNYAPTYLELGEAYTAARQYTKAADAYDAYVLLAPNFADANDVRSRAEHARTLAKQPIPSLRP
jgi:tetratricopeptide (TPR) repeat protein